MRLLLGACMQLLLGAKYAPFGCMYAETVGCKVYGCWVQVCGSWVQVYGCFWVHVYAFWVHVYAFWVHVYGSVGCMYAAVGCKVYGDVWVQSICLLGASLIRLKACLIVGSLPDSR